MQRAQPPLKLRRDQRGKANRQLAGVKGNAANLGFNPDSIMGALEKCLDCLQPGFLYVFHGPVLHVSEKYL